MPDKPTPAMINGQMTYVRPDEIEYEIPNSQSTFAHSMNMVPMMSSVSGLRALMGSKFMTQALPLKNIEAPLVEALDEETGDSFSKRIGSRMGLIKSPEDGVVDGVFDDYIRIKNSAGKKVDIPMRHYLPQNKKTFTKDNPLVKPGDQVVAGQTLAHSNYTTPDGELAYGANLRVAFMPGPQGKTFEDAITVSESAAKRLTSTHLYSFGVDHKLGLQSGKNKFIQLFPNKYTKEQLDKIDDNGMVKSGVDLEPGDPIFLSYMPRTLRAQDKALGNLNKVIKNAFVDRSETWEKSFPGRSVDSTTNRHGYSVNVVGEAPLQFADKISGRFAAKGVTALVQPDDKMYRDSEGNVIDVLINPASLIGRVNPASALEAVLGKIALKTGKKYNVANFSDDSNLEFVEREMKKHGISDTEDLFDPVNNRKVPNVLTGVTYMMKLEHQSADKWSAIDEGSTDQNDQPGKPGGHDSSKKVGYLEVLGLLGHGAKENLADIQQYRSGSNKDMWRRIRMGLPLPAPEVPFIYNKFTETLRGAGINTQKTGSKVMIKALRRKDIDDLVGQREVLTSETIDPITKDPVRGGLLDMSLHGIDGKRWSYIQMDEPLPNPILEEPLRRVLGITKQKMLDVMSGKDNINGKSGTQGLIDAYKAVDSKELEVLLMKDIRSGRKTTRDLALKRLNALKGIEKQGLEADDLFMQKVPVLPAAYRPVNAFGNLMLAADINYLYKDLIEARDAKRITSRELGEEESGEETLTKYKALEAVVGLGDPIHPKHAQKGLKGFVRQLSEGGPKRGQFLDKVIGHTVNTIGRGVVIPDTEMDMDTLGVPENIAWKLFGAHTMGRMVRAGMSPEQAALNIERKTDYAKKFLLQEMDYRPVMLNRAPSLHKFNTMAFKPRLVAGDGIMVSPLVVKPFNMDFDGDATNIHVPISPKAVDEAKTKLMPSQNLFDLKQKRVHYVPSQEFTLGIYNSTQQNATKRGVKFKTSQDAIQAYASGEIDIDTPVEIG